MNEFESTQNFRLSIGGLFYRLMLRLGLVEANRYLPWRRITLFIALTWLPLLILSAVNGTLIGSSVGITFIRDLVPHARFLFALPLLVLAELYIDRHMSAIVRHFQVSDFVPKDAKLLYDKAFEQLTQLRDAGWVDVVLFGLAFGLGWILKFKFGISTLDIEMSSWMETTSGTVERLTPAGWWLISVSIPFVLFIFYRWFWRLIIWIRFMNSLSRLGLALKTTHPDKVGGLEPLISAQYSFGLIFSALGATTSATLAREIIYFGSTLAEVQLSIIGFVLICFIIIGGPLCTFTSQLINAKRNDLRRYSAVATQLSETFEKLWIKNTKGRQLKGSDMTLPPSTVTGYRTIYEKISSMRLIPFKKQMIFGLAIILAAPFIPLVFTQISLKEIVKQLASTLV